MTNIAPPIVLASSSRYRVELLSRLKLPFTHYSPDVDETPAPGEAPYKLAIRLAEAKAQALSSRFPQHLIIGSDQVAVCNDQILNKPGNRQNALQQLRYQSEQTTLFHTAVALYNSRTNTLASTVTPTRVVFRQLNEAEVTRYVDADQPFHCAGSFKSEGLGISLFKSAVSDDPTALIGLPLIATCELLRGAGYFSRM